MTSQFLAAGVVVAAQSLQAGSLTERAIAAPVHAHNGDALALLERVVKINSGAENLDGVREIGQLVRAGFDRLGFKTEWVDGAVLPYRLSRGDGDMK